MSDTVAPGPHGAHEQDGETRRDFFTLAATAVAAVGAACAVVAARHQHGAVRGRARGRRADRCRYLQDRAGPADRGAVALAPGVHRAPHRRRAEDAAGPEGDGEPARSRFRRCCSSPTTPRTGTARSSPNISSSSASARISAASRNSSRSRAARGRSWQGGYFCPCHGSRYDLAARVFEGVPAPYNLPVPPHHFLSDTVIRVGENPPDSTFDLNDVEQV